MLNTLYVSYHKYPTWEPNGENRAAHDFYSEKWTNHKEISGEIIFVV